MLPLGDSSIPLVPILDPLTTFGRDGRQQSAATYRPTSFVNGPQLNGNAFNTISSFPKPASTPSLQLYPGDSASQNHGHLHGHHNRRRGHHLNKIPTEKKFYWKVVGYTNCTEICGGGKYDIYFIP